MMFLDQLQDIPDDDVRSDAELVENITSFHPVTLTSNIVDLYNIQYRRPENWIDSPRCADACDDVYAITKEPFQISTERFNLPGCQPVDIKSRRVFEYIQVYPVKIPVRLTGTIKSALKDGVEIGVKDMFTEKEKSGGKKCLACVSLFLAPGTEELEKYREWYRRVFKNEPLGGLYRVARPGSRDFAIPNKHNKTWMADVRNGNNWKRYGDYDDMRNQWKIYENPQILGFGIVPGIVELHAGHPRTSVTNHYRYCLASGLEPKLNRAAIYSAHKDLEAKQPEVLRSHHYASLTFPHDLGLKLDEVKDCVDEKCGRGVGWKDVVLSHGGKDEHIFMASPVRLETCSMAEAVLSRYAKTMQDYQQGLAIRTDQLRHILLCHEMGRDDHFVTDSAFYQ